jgi:hypothetical protein
MMTTTPAMDAAAPVKRRVPRAAAIVGSLVMLAVVLAAFAYFSASTRPAPEPLPVPEPVAEVPDAMIDRLDRLETMMRDLTAKLVVSIDTQTAIAADVTTLRLRADAEAEKAAEAARAAAARNAAVQQNRRTARPAARSATPTNMAVLSVDSWGGKPSVVIRDGDGKVQFLTLGDRLPGGGVIGAVQVAEQRITVRHPNGSVSTMVGRSQ